MHAELRQLSPEDQRDVYDLLQSIPKDENGFVNGGHGRTYEEYRQWLKKSDDLAKGIGLADWMVPQTNYWLFVDGVPVGMGKLRDRLTDQLRVAGGHGGYAIAAPYRGKGYGKLLLRLMIEKAKEKNIDRLLLTVRNHNIPSIRTALANGGTIEKIDGERHYIWIDC